MVSKVIDHDMRINGVNFTPDEFIYAVKKGYCSWDSRLGLLFYNKLKSFPHGKSRFFIEKICIESEFKDKMGEKNEN